MYCETEKRQDDEDTRLDTSCNKEFKGKFTSNLKLHLKKEHFEEYRLLEEEEKKTEQTVKRSGKSKNKCSSIVHLYFSLLYQLLQIKRRLMILTVSNRNLSQKVSSICWSFKRSY